MSTLLWQELAGSQQCRGLGEMSSVQCWVQMAVDDAEHVMNCVAAGEATWDDVRADVAAHYARAGFQNAAVFIRAAV